VVRQRKGAVAGRIAGIETIAYHRPVYW